MLSATSQDKNMLNWFEHFPLEIFCSHFPWDDFALQSNSSHFQADQALAGQVKQSQLQRDFNHNKYSENTSNTSYSFFFFFPFIKNLKKNSLNLSHFLFVSHPHPHNKINEKARVQLILLSSLKPTFWKANIKLNPKKSK